MTSSKITFYGGQAMVRSQKLKFSNKYFCIKAQVSDSKVSHDSKYVISFFTMCRTPKYCKSKIDVILFLLYFALKHQKRFFNFACAYSTCSSLIYCTFFLELHKILDFITVFSNKCFLILIFKFSQIFVILNIKTHNFSN